MTRALKSDGHEVVVGQQDGKPQRRLARTAHIFSRAKRQKFFDALACTCNVGLAARHAGVTVSTVYYHRVRDATFAAQWRDALTAGYDTLEALVLEHGGAGQPLEPADPTREAHAAPPFDFDRALAVLRQYRGPRDGHPLHRAVRPIAATREETNAALRKALTAAHKRMERERLETERLEKAGLEGTRPDAAEQQGAQTGDAAA